MVNFALRVAVAALAIAGLLPSLASPAPDARPRPRVRSSLRFQEQYRDRLYRERDDGESWLEQAAVNTYKVRAVVPIDGDLVDVDAFDGETEFFFDIGDAYGSATLNEDPAWRPGRRSARLPFEMEDVWYGPDEEFLRERWVGTAVVLLMATLGVAWLGWLVATGPCDNRRTPHLRDPQEG